MLLLDQVAKLYEKFGASTSVEEKKDVAKQICLECSMSLWKLCNLEVPQVMTFNSDSALLYYELARRANKYGKSRENEYERTVIMFYAATLKEKSLWLSKLSDTTPL